MKRLNHKLLWIKSQNIRNIEKYYRIANIDANREWGKSENLPLPKYERIEVKSNLVGYLNFFKDLLLDFIP